MQQFSRSDIIYFVLLVVVLLLIEVIYLRLARKVNIFSPSNERSSHHGNTIIGGGIIFFFAVLIYSIYYHFPYPSFLLGAFFLALISFIDDLSYVKHSYRLLVHLLALTLLIPQLQLFNYSYFYVFCIIILGVSVLNAYNFIDGINGMLGFQCLIVLCTLTCLNIQHEFINKTFLISVIVSVIVFLIFNFRNKALCFAGDTGSIVIGYCLFFATLSLILKTGDFFYLLLLSVPGTDAALTLLFRILNKENILLPHRTFLFHILVHKISLSHIAVTLLYGLIQIAIATFVIIIGNNYPGLKLYYFISIIILLILSYLYFRKKYYNLNITLFSL